MGIFGLSLRNLLRHPVRSLLTALSLMVAIFLLCSLRSMVTALTAAATEASTTRLWVQSAVSLYVGMPLSYPTRIEAIDGVKEAFPFQWFGGVYQDPSNFFGQFAVDPEKLLRAYPELVWLEGSPEDFIGTRTGALVGTGLAKTFDWKVGDKIPLSGALFPHPDGVDVAWDFEVVGIYEASKASLDENTFFFHWDYFEKTLEVDRDAPVEVGAIVVSIEPTTSATRVMSEIDALYENGPQRVQTTTESEFQAQFASMFGNVPFFVSVIGGAVLAAIVLACINTMLMAAREQTHDIGIMKSLGFPDTSMFRLLLTQSFLLCGVGGAMGLGLALGSEGGMRELVSSMLPAYRILDETKILAVVLIVVIGLVAGIAPALRSSRLKCIDALSARE